MAGPSSARSRLVSPVLFGLLVAAAVAATGQLQTVFQLDDLELVNQQGFVAAGLIDVFHVYSPF